MVNKEKVIRGLKCCASMDANACNKCMYIRCRPDRYCFGNLAADALALLKAQEPRVMDFDDVVGGDECWLEAVNGACGYADCYACTGTGEVQVFRCKHDNPQYIIAEDYLKTWRCWTSRPTDEQREATPWTS